MGNAHSETYSGFAPACSTAPIIPQLTSNEPGGPIQVMSLRFCKWGAGCRGVPLPSACDFPWCTSSWDTSFSTCCSPHSEILPHPGPCGPWMRTERGLDSVDTECQDLRRQGHIAQPQLLSSVSVLGHGLILLHQLLCYCCWILLLNRVRGPGHACCENHANKNLSTERLLVCFCVTWPHIPMLYYISW